MIRDRLQTAAAASAALLVAVQAGAPIYDRCPQ